MGRGGVAVAGLISRRRLLERAWRAGVGVGALGLVGCGGPEVYNTRREEEDGADSQGSSRAVAEPAASPLAGGAEEQQEAVAAAVVQEEEEGEEQAAGEAVQSAQAQVEQDGEELTPLEIVEPVVPDDVVDALVWRERYHWRKLAALPGRAEGPVQGRALHVHAITMDHWSPFAMGPPGFGPGPLLPLLYSQLVVMASGDERDAHRGEIEGDLAAGWETPDATTLRFQLRDDVHWPDSEPLNGRRLNAPDVLISHEAYLSESFQQSGAYEAVERIEVGDESAVTFHLREPASYLPAKMTDPLRVIGLPHFVDDPGAGIVNPLDPGPARGLHGTGPFMMEYVGASSWGLGRNPNYFKRDPGSGAQLPYLDHLGGGRLFSRIPTGFFADRSEVWRDWVDERFDAIKLLSPSELEESRAVHADVAAEVVAPTPGRGSELRFSEEGGGQFADARVRKALSMALDRGLLADQIHHGLAAPDCGHDWTHVVDDAGSDADGAGFREWPWTVEELGDGHRFDPEAALALLAAAGYSADAPLALNLDAGGDGISGGSSAAAAAAAHHWLSQLGAAVQVQLLPRKTETVQEGDATSAGGARILHRVTPHPEAEIHPVWRQPHHAADPDELTYGRLHSSRNGQVRDGVLDDLCERQRRELDAVRRSELLERIRLRDAELGWRLTLVNPYGLIARRGHAFNVGGAYFAHDFERNPKQFERAWRLPREEG